MTKREDADFRQMYMALRRILAYMTPSQIRRDAAKGILSFEEYIEMAYENIQQEAKSGLRRIRLPKDIELITPSSGPPLGARKKEAEPTNA